jgi:predicted metal-dependent hydrolase
MTDFTRAIQTIRSKRRTISIEIKREGTVLVRAPNHAGEKFIRAFIEKHRLWIEKKLRRLEENASPPREFREGETFLYLGTPRNLRFVDNGGPLLDFDGEFLLSGNARERARDIFIDWYRKQASETIVDRVARYAALAGESYGKIKITGAGGRWGSCGTRGNLNFSWRLIMAPLEVVDYVVAHEIAHLAEKNHSKRFWLRVSALYPEYRAMKKWLRDHGHTLEL